MSETKMAVLIDADNSNSTELLKMWPVISRLGRIDIARAYGDWASSSLQLMRQQCLSLGIECVQQNVYVTGKNATDMAMTIDAVSMCHAEPIGQIVLFSKDSDFTPLAHWLSARNVAVVGVGGHDSSWAFKRACTLFLDPDHPDVGLQSDNKARHLLSATLVHLKQFYGKRDVYPLEQVLQAFQEIEPEFTSVRYGAFSVREMLMQSGCARVIENEDDPMVSFQFESGYATNDGAGNQVQHAALLKKMLRDAKMLPFFNGYLQLSVAKRLSSCPSSSDFDAFYTWLQHAKEPPMVLHIPRHEPVLWMEKKAAKLKETCLRGKELLLRAIRLQIEQQGQAVIFTTQRLRRVIGTIDPELTWSKYGVSDLDGLLLAHPELLTKIPASPAYPGAHVGVTGNHQMSLYEHLQGMLSVLRSTMLRNGGLARWASASDWERQLKLLLPDFHIKNYAIANIYSLWWVFKAQIEVQKSDGNGRPRQARFLAAQQSVMRA